jgi:hypothetical protein
VHATYVAWIQPNGDAIVASEQARMHSDPNFVPARTFLLVVNGGAQEAEIIHFVWAMLIILYKWLLLRRERKLLDRDLIHVPEGIKVLPEDAKDYARQLEQLPQEEKGMLVVRALQRTLDRFAATRSIRDSAETSRAVCDTEADRLDSGFAMIRYVAWAIPAIGFIGTGATHQRSAAASPQGCDRRHHQRDLEPRHRVQLDVRRAVADDRADVLPASAAAVAGKLRAQHRSLDRSASDPPHAGEIACSHWSS